MSRLSKKPWSEMTLEEKETQALVLSMISMPDCPFYKYKQMREK